MKALYRLVSSKDDDTGVLIDQALFFGCTELRMTFGYVVQGTTGAFIVRHRQGVGDIIPIGSRLPITTAIGERIRATPGTVAIDDLAAETDGDEMNARGLPWRSFVGIRIAVDGAPYGALLFMDAHVRERPLNRAELDFVVLLGSIVEAAVAREARVAHIKKTQIELEHEARTDHLTGIANRRQFSYLAEIEIDRAIRDRREVSVLLLDIDCFKQINDTYGHKTGDRVLRQLAELCSHTLRESDVVGRIGGEEFALLLPESNMAQALELAERLRWAIATDAVRLDSDESIHITVSIGVSTLCADVRTIEGLLAAADVALYEAKNGGRNTVRTARQTVP
jgi:diguanylate cyclase (GGDEF)-like protein